MKRVARETGDTHRDNPTGGNSFEPELQKTKFVAADMQHDERRLAVGNSQLV